MSIAQQIEIDNLKERLQNLEDDKLIGPFINSMLEKIGILLADTAYDDWPDMCKLAFSSAAKEFPNAAHVYMTRVK